MLYNIDRIDYRENGIIAINGWVIDETGVNVDIELSGTDLYRIVRSDRSDLHDVYQNARSNSGFIIELLPAKRMRHIEVLFLTDSEREIYKLKVKRRLFYEELDISFLLSGGTGETDYNIDKFFLDFDSHAFYMTGWSASHNKLEMDISSIIDKKTFARQDVCEHLNRSIEDGNFGFEVYAFWNCEKGICLLFGDKNRDYVELSFANVEAMKSIKCDSVEEDKLLISTKIEEKKNSRPYVYSLTVDQPRDMAFDNYEVVIPCQDEVCMQTVNEISNKMPGAIVTPVITDLSAYEEDVFQALKNSNRKYLMVVQQEDDIEPGAICGVESEMFGDIVCFDYDLICDGQHIIKVERTDLWDNYENDDYILLATVINHKLIEESSGLRDLVATIKALPRERKKYVDEVMYHYSCVEDKWGRARKVKNVAFYLPQYHITPENNKWWGDGFTEWKNVKRGRPLIEGQHQPRVPTDLGYYDLVEDKSIQKKQVELAKRFDLYGFCFYYYWFEKKRLLYKPVDSFLDDKTLDFPFCICWANESWTKRWDGLDEEILVKQVHNEKTDKEFIYDVIPILKDERYIKYDGKPLLLIYRIGLFPNPRKTIEYWRKCCKKEGVGDICIGLIQCFDMIDYRAFGADLAVEFPPHKFGSIHGVNVTGDVNAGDDFSGCIFDYKKLVENLSTITPRDYNMIPGAMMEWDNTARKMKNAHFWINFSPELFKRWLIKNKHYSNVYNKDSFAFINAWNEWAEGTYLEPDEKYGTTFLEIVKEVTNMR